jgi:hypothetical protein
MHVRQPLLLAGVVLASCGPTVEAHGPDRHRSYLSEEARVELFDLERADYLLGLALKPFQDSIHSAPFEGADLAVVSRALAAGFSARLARLPHADELASAARFYCDGALETLDAVDGRGFVRWIGELGELFEEIEAVSFARYRNSHEIIEGPHKVAESRGPFRIAGSRPGGARLEITGTFLLRHAGFDRFDEDSERASALPSTAWIHALELEDVGFTSSAFTLFADVTADSGIDTEVLHDNWEDRERGLIIFTGGAILGDVDADGHLDLLLTEMLRSYLYLGDGTGKFRDSGWTPPAPIMPVGDKQRVFEPYGAIFDATGDGRLDVLHAGMLFTWNAAEKRMKRVPGATQLPNADATLCDYDRDGLVDLYFVNSGRKAPRKLRPDAHLWFDDERVSGRANQLLRNLGRGQFEDVTASARAAAGFGRTFAATWFYADGDDWPDVFGANEFGKNQFLVSNGDGTFREAADVDPVFGGFSMGVSSGDVDGDGRSDLYVSNMYSKAGQRVYHQLDLSIYPESARNMFIASVTGNRLYRSRGDLTFENTSAYSGGYAVGWGFSGAILDADLDGWLDLYAPCGYISIDPNKPDG